GRRARVYGDVVDDERPPRRRRACRRARPSARRGGLVLDERLLDLLRCPETRERLSLAPRDLVERINARIGRQALLDRKGDRVTVKIDAALVREDGKLAYPVRSRIPDLLTGDAIPLEQLAGDR